MFGRPSVVVVADEKLSASGRAIVMVLVGRARIRPPFFCDGIKSRAKVNAKLAGITRPIVASASASFVSSAALSVLFYLILSVRARLSYLMAWNLSRVLCSTSRGIFSLLVFFFFMEDGEETERKESLKSSRPREILNLLFLLLSFCKVRYILVVQSQRYKQYIIERLLLWLSTAGKFRTRMVEGRGRRRSSNDASIYNI